MSRLRSGAQRVSDGLRRVVQQAKVQRRLARVNHEIAANAVLLVRYRQILALADRHRDVMYGGYQMPARLARASNIQQIVWRVAAMERRAREHGLLSELDGPALPAAQEKN